MCILVCGFQFKFGVSFYAREFSNMPPLYAYIIYCYVNTRDTFVFSKMTCSWFSYHSKTFWAHNHSCIIAVSPFTLLYNASVSWPEINKSVLRTKRIDKIAPAIVAKPNICIKIEKDDQELIPEVLHNLWFLSLIFNIVCYILWPVCQIIFKPFQCLVFHTFLE